MNSTIDEPHPILDTAHHNNVRDEYLARGFTNGDLVAAEPLFPDAPPESSAAESQRFSDYLCLRAIRREGYTYMLGVYAGGHGLTDPLLFGPELGDVSDATDATTETFEAWLDERYPG